MKARKKKKNKVQIEWSIHKGPGHDLLVPSQYMRGLFWGSRSNFFGKRCPAGMVSHLKKVNVGWDHMMHAIEVGNEEA